MTMSYDLEEYAKLLAAIVAVYLGPAVVCGVIGGVTAWLSEGVLHWILGALCGVVVGAGLSYVIHRLLSRS